MQCLANPNYLNCKFQLIIFHSTFNSLSPLFYPPADLAQRGYFKDKAFINYLDYLQYWKRPEYAKFIKYPMCLHFLDLLQAEHFRRELTSTQCSKFIDDQIILHWHHYARKRTRLFSSIASSQGQQGQQKPNTSGQQTESSNSTTASSAAGAAAALPPPPPNHQQQNNHHQQNNNSGGSGSGPSTALLNGHAKI